jgi:hypothetical protein
MDSVDGYTFFAQKERREHTLIEAPKLFFAVNKL